jgi:hypothetical protein
MLEASVENYLILDQAIQQHRRASILVDPTYSLKDEQARLGERK